MANMSYCMFENTYNDLKDCVEAMEVAMYDGVSLKEFTRTMSNDELRAFKEMVTLCARMIEAQSDMTNMQLNEYDLSDKCFEDIR